MVRYMMGGEGLDDEPDYGMSILGGLYVGPE